MSKTAAANPVKRIGAIDVGTNSIRLIVAEASADGTYRVLDDEKETTRLGQGLEATGNMALQAMERSAQAIARMKSIANGFGVEMLRAIGTCAVREAANREEFLNLVRQQAGLDVEPIAARDEAYLSHLSVGHAFDLSKSLAAVVDLGGGSAEVILSSFGVIDQVFSLPLGAVRLSEKFPGLERYVGKDYRRMRRSIRRVLNKTVGKSPFVPQLLIGTGGTFTSLANIALQNGSQAEKTSTKGSARGYALNRSQLRHLIDWLRKLPLKTRTKIPGLSPDRADIIVAGAVIIERIMKHLGVNRLQVHDGGVRDGLLRTMVNTLFPRPEGEAPEPPGPMRSVLQFAASCGFEERHCRHVAYLATSLFDQLAPVGLPQWADPANRLLLEAAAFLKDIGYLINYSKHHLHSYHLVIHSDLAGFTPRQIHVLACIVRYHRKAPPQMKHPEFASLSKADRELVGRLAALLRLADGLDRNRLNNVRNVNVRLEKNKAYIDLEAAENPTVELWGAESKSPLFHQVFDMKTYFTWRQSSAMTVGCSEG